MKPSHLQQLQICNAIMPTGFCILTTTNKLCQNTCNHFIYTKRCFQNHFFLFCFDKQTHTHTTPAFPVVAGNSLRRFGRTKSEWYVKINLANLQKFDHIHSQT